MSRWFRVDDGLIDDPKVQRLPDRLFRAVVNLWCVTSQNGGKLPSLDQMAFKLRSTEAKTSKIIEELQAVGLIDETDNGDGTHSIAPHNWNGRQFKSDVSTDRVKALRERRRNVSSTVSVTPPEAETDNRPEALASGARKRATRLSADWWPSLDNINYAIAKGFTEQRIGTEAEKFRNYWIAKSGAGAAKLDWNATWQNWILNATERNGGPRNGGQQQSLGDIARELADEVRERERSLGLS